MKNYFIMLLSDWYAKWKAQRIQEAIEEAKTKGYEEGYADGKLGTPNLKGIRLTRGRHTEVVSRGRSKGDVVTHPKRSK